MWILMYTSSPTQVSPAATNDRCAMKPKVGLRSVGDILVTSSEPDRAIKPPTHGQPYKISMTLLIILGTWGVIIALFYWASFYD